MSTYATELTIDTTGSEPGVEVMVSRNLLVPDVDGYVARLDVEVLNELRAPSEPGIVSVYLTEEQAGLLAASLTEIVTT